MSRVIIPGEEYDYMSGRTSVTLPDDEYNYLTGTSITPATNVQRPPDMPEVDRALDITAAGRPASFADVEPGASAPLSAEEQALADLAVQQAAIDRQIGQLSSEDPLSEPGSNGPVAQALSGPSKDEALVGSYAPSEEELWANRSRDTALASGIGMFARSLRATASPEYGFDRAAQGNAEQLRQLRGEFDYERQLRAQGRNEHQEDEVAARARVEQAQADEDRLRRIADSEEAAARRRVVEGRQDVTWQQGQDDRTSMQSSDSSRSRNLQLAAVSMLESVSMPSAEAQRLVGDLAAGDEEAQRMLELIARNRLAALSAAVKDRNRSGGGGGGSGGEMSADYLMHLDAQALAARGMRPRDAVDAQKRRAELANLLAHGSRGAGRILLNQEVQSMQSAINAANRNMISSGSTQVANTSTGAAEMLSALSPGDSDRLARILAGEAEGGIAGGAESLSGRIGSMDNEDSAMAAYQQIGQIRNTLMHAWFGSAQTTAEAKRLAGLIRGTGLVANGRSLSSWLDRATRFIRDHAGEMRESVDVPTSSDALGRVSAEPSPPRPGMVRIRKRSNPSIMGWAQQGNIPPDAEEVR